MICYGIIYENEFYPNMHKNLESYNIEEIDPIFSYYYVNDEGINRIDFEKRKCIFITEENKLEYAEYVI